MKFVNKLSVISLLVLMFSFMNVAGAVGASGASGDMNGDDNRNNKDSGPPTCPGYAESSCDSFNNLGEKYASKREEFCNMAYIKKSATKNVTCKWTTPTKWTNPLKKDLSPYCAETQTECVVRNKAGY